MKRKEPDRKNANERGYTYRWQKAREAWLCSHPLCRECELFGAVVPAAVIDHKHPHRGDSQWFWDSDNWSGLCKRHHDQKTIRESNALSKYVVCGPPGSGKTTWVRARAKQGDLVWDADYIVAQMFSAPLHAPVDHVAALIERMRPVVVDWLLQYPDCHAYIIQSDTVKARETARWLDAELVEVVKRS